MALTVGLLIGLDDPEPRGRGGEGVLDPRGSADGRENMRGLGQRAHFNRIRPVVDQSGPNQTVRQETANALDGARCSSSAPGWSERLQL